MVRFVFFSTVFVQNQYQKKTQPNITTSKLYRISSFWEIYIKFFFYFQLKWELKAVLQYTHAKLLFPELCVCEIHQAIKWRTIYIKLTLRKLNRNHINVIETEHCRTIATKVCHQFCKVNGKCKREKIGA